MPKAARERMGEVRLYVSETGTNVNRPVTAYLSGRDCHKCVIASEAKQSRGRRAGLDCFVASLLAMTGSDSDREKPQCSARSLQDAIFAGHDATLSMGA